MARADQASSRHTTTATIGTCPQSSMPASPAKWRARQAALGVPTSARVARQWRLRDESVSWSKSISRSRPTPDRSSKCAAWLPTPWGIMPGRRAHREGGAVSCSGRRDGGVMPRTSSRQAARQTLNPSWAAMRRAAIRAHGHCALWRGPLAGVGRSLAWDVPWRRMLAGVVCSRVWDAAVRSCSAPAGCTSHPWRQLLPA